jgi:hypothetical protein
MPNELGCCVDKRYGSPQGCTPETCMQLPDGATCNGCGHVKRCKTFGFTSSTSNTYCSFFPRRFVPAELVEKEPDPCST